MDINDYSELSKKLYLTEYKYKIFNYDALVYESPKDIESNCFGHLMRYCEGRTFTEKNTLRIKLNLYINQKEGYNHKLVISEEYINEYLLFLENLFSGDLKLKLVKKEDKYILKAVLININMAKIKVFGALIRYLYESPFNYFLKQSIEKNGINNELLKGLLLEQKEWDKNEINVFKQCNTNHSFFAGYNVNIEYKTSFEYFQERLKKDSIKYLYSALNSEETSLHINTN